MNLEAVISLVMSITVAYSFDEHVGDSRTNGSFMIGCMISHLFLYSSDSDLLYPTTHLILW